jgi:hypothetical protein
MKGVYHEKNLVGRQFVVSECGLGEFELGSKK